jgi:hypothetical protein
MRDGEPMMSEILEEAVCNLLLWMPEDKHGKWRGQYLKPRVGKHTREKRGSQKASLDISLESGVSVTSYETMKVNDRV